MCALVCVYHCMCVCVCVCVCVRACVCVCCVWHGVCVLCLAWYVLHNRGAHITCTSYSHCSISYYEVGHTLCPTLNGPLDELAAGFNVTVAIYTFSTTPVMVYTEANGVENFILKYGML